LARAIGDWDGRSNLGNGTGGKDDSNPTGCCVGSCFFRPQRADMARRPRRVGHYYINTGATGTVHQRKYLPVLFFDFHLDRDVLGGEGVEHVGGDGGVVHICSYRKTLGAKEELREGVCEWVSHGINEEVWNELGKGGVGKGNGAERLEEKGEVRIELGVDEASVGNVNEGDAGGVERDAKTVLQEVS